MEDMKVNYEIYSEKDCNIKQGKTYEIGRINININIDISDFDEKLIENIKDELSNKITEEITKLKSCENFKINGSVKFGSIEFMAIVYTFANYDNIKDGFSSLIDDIKNNKQIVVVCHKVLKPIKNKKLMDEYKKGINNG